MKRDVFYEDLLKPLLFAIEPEDAHDLVHKLLRMFGWALDKMPYRYESRDLTTSVGNMIVENPVGLAAGFDKNGELIHVIGSLGFGFVEVGSITARASQGNQKPRLFRLPEDRALINRMGLNGDGADAVAQRLKLCHSSLPFGINIAKTNDPSVVGDRAVEDVLHSFKSIKDISAGYVALNASCPNTHEGCVQETGELAVMFTEIQKLNERKIPIFVKLSPDSSDEFLDSVIDIAGRNGLTGFVCGNTTTARTGLHTSPSVIEEIGRGGLSGSPLRTLALELCRKVARRKSKSQQIIAVGGIGSGADAYELIKSGACAIELYTALIYKGPSLPMQICLELSELLRRDGHALRDAVGVETK